MHRRRLNAEGARLAQKPDPPIGGKNAVPISLSAVTGIKSTLLTIAALVMAAGVNASVIGTFRLEKVIDVVRVGFGATVSAGDIPLFDLEVVECRVVVEEALRGVGGILVGVAVHAGEHLIPMDGRAYRAAVRTAVAL